MEAKKLVKKCFEAWKRIVHYKKERQLNAQKKIQQKEKIENLIRTLKHFKKQKEVEMREVPQVKKTTATNYENRYEAQKSAIEKLTIKLEEKDRLIDELKLGIFNKEALKALNQSKIDIHEIFANCSARVRCKIPPPPEFSEKFMIQTQKAPKIMQEMEEKALERAKRREIIMERRQVILENRKRMIQEALERKRIQDEEEKKKNLEKIKEHRRLELELRKKREANKLIYMEKLKAALALYREKLKLRAFKNWVEFYLDSKRKEKISNLHYKMTLTNKILFLWKEFVEDKYSDKKALADAVFAKNILSTCLKTWRQMRIESIRSMQVAEDFYDLMLVNNVFVHWHRYVCLELILVERKMLLAKQHYNKRIMFHFFYQWRSLPAVIQLEKAKEMKMKKWRAKVWEILPDYKPPTED